MGGGGVAVFDDNYADNELLYLQIIPYTVSVAQPLTLAAAAAAVGARARGAAALPEGADLCISAAQLAAGAPGGAGVEACKYK